MAEGLLMRSRRLGWWEALFLSSAIAYFAWHLALAVAHVTPDQFIGGVARALGLG